ncbi:hypothetical protein C8T65DRAFT_626243 [Cerioporus squamosus]|nr:hypothetical protein C8T65DRAFT_626243 [Cerioporus squamosus]
MASTSTTRRAGTLLASHTRSLAASTRAHASIRSRAAGPHAPVRRYAQVGSTTFLGVPPSAPGPTPVPRAAASPQPTSQVKAFDANVLSELHRAASEHPGPSGVSAAAPGSAITPLTELVEQYMKHEERRVQFSRDATNANVEVSTADGALFMVAHAVHDRTGKHKITYSSGFAVHAPGTPDGQVALVTCAHTLEEIRHDPLLRAARPNPAVAEDQLLSGSFVIAGSSAAPTFHPVSSILSAMHRGDLLLLSSPSVSSGLRSLPVNPYPVHPGTPIRAHYVTDKPPETGPHRDGWTPWVGGTWRKWIKGTVVGYRDYAGREAKPGTYDSLAHLHFDPPPTPGSSGGPIIDEESGSVIGVILGTQLVNQVEGVRGWGVPAEMIYEMFSLPGLKLKSQA